MSVDFEVSWTFSLEDTPFFTSKDVVLMDWSLVYCDVLISDLDSHSDGTHPLQRASKGYNATFLFFNNLSPRCGYSINVLQIKILFWMHI